MFSLAAVQAMATDAGSKRRLSEALEEPCDSGDKFDIKVKACEDWCDAEYAADHCLGG